jgi:penicillin-insensitive murein endopeptidase
MVHTALAAALGVAVALMPSSGHAEKSASGAGAGAQRGDEGVARGKRAVDTESLPEAFRKPPFSKQALSVGAPNRGRLVRGKRIPHDASIRLFKPTSDRGFAVPLLTKTLAGAAKQVRRRFPESTLLVVELSSKDGGPAPQKHSHQSGRDADLAFYALDKKGHVTQPKHLVHYDGSGKAMDGSGLRFDDDRNWALCEALATKDSPVTHVFVDPKLRQRLLVFADRSGKKPERVERVSQILFADESGESTDAYFHVRVRCPNGQTGLCEEASK